AARWTWLAGALDVGAVCLEPGDELLWVTQRGRVAAVQLVGRDAQPLPDHALSGHGCSNGVADSPRTPLAIASVTTSGGTSWKNVRSGSYLSSGDRPARSSSSRTACSHPVLVHQSLADSPGAGTIAATSTSRSTGTRSHTKGAVNPAMDCATSTRSVRG